MLFNNFINRNIGDIGKLNSEKLAKYQNDLVFNNVFEFLKNMAINGRYKIEGLPDTCSERVILESLFYYGDVYLFHWKEAPGVYSLPGTNSGYFDIYGEPREAYVYSFNGKIHERLKLIKDKEALDTLLGVLGEDIENTNYGILIKDSYSRRPFFYTTFYYAEAIADCLRSLDTLRQNLKAPFLVACDQNMINSVKAFFEKRKNNEPIILSSSVFPVDKIKVMNIPGNDTSIQSITALLDYLFNQYKLILGVNSTTNIDKKGENMLVEEINGNEEAEDITAAAFLKPLRETFTIANTVLGTNITVRAVEEKKQSEFDLEEEEEEEEEDHDEI